MTLLRVIGIGTPTLDRLIRVPGPPDFGAGMLVENLGIDGGGPVATALVAAKRLGLKASLATRLGRDEAASQIIEGLAFEGVDLTHVDRVEATRTATSVILVDPAADRAILYDPGNQTEPILSDKLLSAVAEADGLLLERTNDASLNAASHAREHGTVVLLDAGGYDERVMEIAPLCHIVIGSAYHAEARGLDPIGAIEELLDTGVAVGIITMGQEGSVGMMRGEDPAFVPSLRVDAVDTTGAGDVFHGAFLAAWLRHQSITYSMRFASVVAGIKCMKPGGRAGIPDLTRAEQVLDRWSSGVTGAPLVSDTDER